MKHVRRVSLALVAMALVAGVGCGKAKSVTAPPRPPQVDLSLEAIFAAPLVVGTESYLDLLVLNRGSQPSIVPVLVSDSLPAGLTFTGAIGKDWLVGTSESGAVNASLTVPVAPGDSARLRLRLAVAPAARLGGRNIAVLKGGGDETPANNVAQSIVQADIMDIALGVSAPTAFRFGSPAEWQLQVANVGSLPTAGDIVVRDTLPQGVVFASAIATGWRLEVADNVVTATYPGPVAPGDSTHVRVRAEIANPAMRVVSNLVSVDLVGDPIADNNRVLSNVNVDIEDLAVEVARSSEFNAGSMAAWTIAVTNTGTLPTTADIVVADSLLGGVSIASASGAGWQLEVAASALTGVRAAPLAPGARAEITVTVALPSSGVARVGNHVVLSSQGDQDPINNQASDLVSVVPPRGVELIMNGSFEDGPGYRANLGAGSPALPGWTIVNGGVDYEPVTGGWCQQVPDAIACIDLSSFSAGGVVQQIPTLAGARYELRWWVAGNWDGAPGSKTYDLAVGGQRFASYSILRNASSSCSGWTERVIQFTATGDATEIAFISTTGSAYGPLLDAVSVKRL